MRKKMKFLFRCLIIAVLIGTVKLQGSKVYAADLAVSASGNSVTISSQYTGRVNISVSGGTASESSVWLENGSKTITVSGVSENGATVTVTPAQIQGQNALSDGDGNIVAVGSKSVTIAGNKTTSNSGTSGSSSSTTNNSSNNSSNGNSNANSNTNSNNAKTTQQEKEPTFKNTNETVYATGTVNIRKSYSTSSDVVGSLEKGKSVTRVGIADNGWSKVTYDGGTGYISTSFLTTEKPKEDEKSSDNSLKSLIIKQDGLKPDFNPDTTSYTLEVGLDVEKLEIEAVPNSEKAKVSISGNEKLKEGDNAIRISVTSEKGEVKNYTINVKKQKSVAITLSSMNIEGYKISPSFSPTVFEYKLNISDPSVTKLNINAVASVEEATIEISGNENLKKGDNTINITVKSKDGKDKTIYKIYVNKSATSSTGAGTVTKGKNKFPLFIGIGAIALLIVIIAVVIIRNRKRDNYYEEDGENENYEEDESEDSYGNLYGFSSSKGHNSVYNEYKINNSEKNSNEKAINDIDEYNYDPYSISSINEEKKSTKEDYFKDLFGTVNKPNETFNFSKNRSLKNTMDSYETENNNNNYYDDSNYNSYNYGLQNQRDNAYDIEPSMNKINDKYLDELATDYTTDDDDYRPKRARGKHSR